MQTPYLSHYGQKPSKASLILKLASEKNALFLREKTVAEHRELQQRLASVRPLPPLVHMEEALVGGVPCEWLRGKASPENRVILYLHGGSWAFGDGKTARPVAALLCELSGLAVLSVQYRLAPEHPFPAGLEDCLSVYQALLSQGYRPDHIALVGDSAGGNLCLCLLHALRQSGGVMQFPACLCLASPVTDLRVTSAIASSGDDLIYTVLNGREIDIFTMYAGQADRSNPLLSPAVGVLEDLPPILMHTGGAEPLAADNAVFAEAVWQAGGKIHLKLWEDMFHDFTVVGITLKESRLSLREFSDFILQHLPADDPSPGAV